MIYVLGMLALIGIAILYDEEARLKILHKTIQGLHLVARLVGTLAIKTEVIYNQYVESLH